MDTAEATRSLDAAEVARFGALADTWWDPDGPFRPLHKLNPARLAYIRDHLVRHYGRDPASTRPLAGLRLLDIGCGGGLLAEPMARLGAEVVGVDAAERNIQVASLHARRAGLDIDYRVGTAEALAAAGERFDVVLNMEVVEHVADVDAFVRACADLLRPGGVMVVSTLNRTARAFMLAIVGAEYVLRWLPRGTHDWRRFLAPSRLARHLRDAGLQVVDLTGLRYSLRDDTWRTSRDLSVNYMGVAAKPGGGAGTAP